VAEQSIWRFFFTDDGVCHIFRWVALLPIKIVLYYTVPNCREPRQVFRHASTYA